MPSSSPTTEAVEVTGRCYCGTIAFAVRIPGGVEPIFTALCHCDSCRRAHAAPLYQVACIEESMYEITAGAARLNEYRKPNSRIVRAFCDECGTRILNRFPGWTPQNKVPLVFFPTLLDDEYLHPLPEVLRPKKHNQPEECVLDWDLLDGFPLERA
jgi:hypothetical protein